MPAEEKKRRLGGGHRPQSYEVEAAEQRNELHLASHEQHRLTTARVIENGITAEKNKFVYEVS